MSSPPENVSSGRSSAASSKPSPRSVAAARSRQDQPPACSSRPGPPRTGAAWRVSDPRRPWLPRASQLVLERYEAGGGGERVLAQGQAAVARRSLVVERDAGVFGECKLTALERGLADDRSQEGRLARSIRAGQRQAVAATHGEGDAVEEGSPENSLRNPDAIKTAMPARRVERVSAE